MPVFLECQRCAACCRWPGQVRLAPEEITRLAAFLGLDESAFIQQHTRLTASRSGLALAEQPDGHCVFLQHGACAVQSVKPQQCRDFPNLWQAPGGMGACQARPREVSPDEFIRLTAAATGRPPETVARRLAARQESRAKP